MWRGRYTSKRLERTWAVNTTVNDSLGKTFEQKGQHPVIHLPRMSKGQRERLVKVYQAKAAQETFFFSHREDIHSGYFFNNKSETVVFILCSFMDL